MKKIVLWLFMMGLVTNSFAGNMCSLSPGITSGFDTILNTYASIATNWTAIILPIATKLFWGLFGLEFLYQLTYPLQKVRYSDVKV